MKKRRLGRKAKIVLGLAALLIVVAWSFGKPYRAVEPLPPDIIDMHCHVAGIGAGGSGCFVSEPLRKSWRFNVYLRSFGTSLDELQEKGDAIVVDRIADVLRQSKYVSHAVLLAMDGVMNSAGDLDTNRTEVYVPNSFVLAAVQRHTNLLFGASVNPHRKDALEQLTRAHEQDAVLIKWLPSIMHIDPADPALIPFYQKLVELQLPLLTHAGNERSFSTAADDFGDPERLRLPLKCGVQVIAAHIASTGSFHGERSTDRLARLMQEFPNLSSEISSLTQLNKRAYMKEALRRPEFAGRLMYGSDFPLINTPLVSSWYYSFRLPPRQMWAISRTGNPWDADVLLKQQLGAPRALFERSRAVLIDSSSADATVP
jgi:predicted TIM-barrel fold metal-dependent hydrolase